MCYVVTMIAIYESFACEESQVENDIFLQILFHPLYILIQTDPGIPLPPVGWGPSNSSNCKNATLHQFLFLGRREIGTKKRNHTARELNSQPGLRPRGTTLAPAFYDLSPWPWSSRRKWPKYPYNNQKSSLMEGREADKDDRLQGQFGHL